MTDRKSPMSMLTLGLVSITVKENDFQYNLEATADLFVFGEVNLTGLNTTHFKSRTFLDTASVLQAINRVTGEYHASICVGFIEHEAEKFYLLHVISSDDTTCGMQRKVLAANPTKLSVYTSGKQINPIIFRGYRVVILACADWLTPEPMIQAGIHEPDLILAPTELPAPFATLTSPNPCPVMPFVCANVLPVLRVQQPVALRRKSVKSMSGHPWPLNNKLAHGTAHYEPATLADKMP